jgi:AraC family carnitine catabolism transcriptional activator
MPIRFGFLLLPLFPMYVVMLATEALRLANKYAGRRVFDWVLLGDDGGAVEASNGIRADCDAAIRDAPDLTYAFVVAGDDQGRRLTKRVRDWLVRLSRSNTILGAIDSGAFILAECRLVGSRPVTVHPAAMAAFREQFPDVPVRSEAVVAGGLVACAGGVSTVGFMLAFIERHCGPAVARDVADDMVLGAPGREPVPTPQRMPQADVEAIVAMMREAIETPLSLRTLSGRAGQSGRQVTRLFRSAVGRPPMAYYRTLRLNHARQLLFQSPLSISEIAIASGFQSVSAFSRCFAAEFGHSPRNLLSSLRLEGHAQAVPPHNRRKRMSLGGT